MSKPDDLPSDVRQAMEPPGHIVDFAVQMSGWSPCRSKRGAILFVGDDVVAHGYNYKPRGFDCDGSEACKSTCRIEAVHAEQQALLAAGTRSRGAEMVHVKSVDGRLVVSGGPSCVQCSKLAAIAGVAGVWLFHESGWKRYPIREFHRLSIEADLLRRESLGKRQAEQQIEAMKKAAYRQARIFEPSMEGYSAAMSVYAAAFGKPDSEPTVILPSGEHKQGWELSLPSSAARADTTEKE